VTAGLKSAGTALLLSALGVYAMQRNSTAFRHQFTAGSKASFVAL
jgi:hypothetical protein